MDTRTYSHYDDEGVLLREPLTKEDVVKIVLHCSSMVTIDGEYLLTFPNLLSIDLSYTMVLDLSDLKRLTSLTELALENTNVIDLSPLSELTALTRLDLYDTNVQDLRPLEGLTSLTTLDLPTYVVSGFTAIEHVDTVYTYGLKLLIVDDEGVENTVDAPVSIRDSTCTGAGLLTELNKVHGWYDRSSGRLTKRASSQRV